MPFPRVVPHSDAAGVIDEVGAGVDPVRIGRRVWVFGAAGAIRAHAPDGVDRVVEVAFSDNVDLDAAVTRNQAVIAAYATHDDRPGFPFWPMLFDNITIRLLGSDDFPTEAKQQAAADLTAAARDGALIIPVGAPLPLDRAAEAHDRVDAGTRERVLLAIPD